MRFFRYGLFQLGKKHAGFALGIDDIYFEFRSAGLPRGIFPNDFVVLFAVFALDHRALSAQFPGLFLVFEINDCDGIRRLADKDELGFRAELLDIGFLMDGFQRWPAFPCRKGEGG